MIGYHSVLVTPISRQCGLAVVDIQWNLMLSADDALTGAVMDRVSCITTPVSLHCVMRQQALSAAVEINLVDSRTQHGKFLSSQTENLSSSRC